MARIVNRVQSNIKGKDDQKKVNNSINTAKKELEIINAEIVAANKVLANTKKQLPIALKEINEAEVKITANKKILDVLNQDINKLSEELAVVNNSVNLAQSNKEEILNDIEKIAANRKAIIEKSEIDYKNVSSELEAKINELKEYLSTLESSKIEKLQELGKLDETYSNAKNKMSEDLSLLAKNKTELENKIFLLQEGLLKEIEITNKNVTKEYEKALSRLEEIKQTIKTKTKTLFEITKNIESTEEKGSAIKAETDNARKILELMNAEIENQRSKAKSELLKISEEKKRETEDLDKIRTQRFGIVKAQKDLHKTYIHIQRLYENANVPMPKLDINLE